MKVLVGDQFDAVRSRLVARLRECGLDVVGEADTVAGITSLAGRVQPDAIVTDIRFPDGCGAAVVVAVRTSAPAALLIVLTNTVHYREPCLSSGADHFLDKSTEFDQVAATLASLPKSR